MGTREPELDLDRCFEAVEEAGYIVMSEEDWQDMYRKLQHLYDILSNTQSTLVDIAGDVESWSLREGLENSAYALSGAKDTVVVILRKMAEYGGV